MDWSERTITTIFLKSSITALAVSLSILSVLFLNTYVRSVQCVFTLDHRLSTQVCQQITDTIKQQVVAGHNYADVAATATAAFPCVENIILHHCAPGIVSCEITSVQPLIQLNQTYVATDQGLLLAPDYFSSTSLSMLPAMRSDDLYDNKCMPASFVAAARAVIPLLGRYDVRWIDENKIIVQEKEAPHFSIICNAHVLPNERMLAYCQQLKQEVCAKTSLKKITKTQQWSADIRFKDQVIAWEGATHG